jgi:hypothetical protein
MPRLPEPLPPIWLFVSRNSGIGESQYGAGNCRHSRRPRLAAGTTGNRALSFRAAPFYSDSLFVDPSTRARRLSGLDQLNVPQQQESFDTGRSWRPVVPQSQPEQPALFRRLESKFLLGVRLGRQIWPVAQERALTGAGNSPL